MNMQNRALPLTNLNDNHRHKNPAVSCDIALKIGNEYYHCSLFNMAQGKVFATILGVDPVYLSPNDVGVCFFDYQGQDLETMARVAHIHGRDLVIALPDLEVKDVIFLNRIIKNCLR